MALRLTALRLAIPLTVLVAAAGMVGCGGDSSPAPEARARHLLLITVDTLRADRLGCFGGGDQVSPAIDRLATQGTLFTRAYTPMSLTLPSMTTLFTSKYPVETGILRNHFKLSEDEQTLAERLATLGFRNRAFVTNPVLRRTDAEVGGARIDQGFLQGEGAGYAWFHDDTSMAAEALAFVTDHFGEAGREFTWIHFVEPHQPYEPPAPYDSLFTAPDYDGPWDGSTDALNRAFTDKVDLSPRDLDHVLGIYDGTVRLVDDQIGALVDALDAKGLAEDTLVVFVADHGEDLYSHHRYFFHSNSIYRSSARIPLVFRQPGVIPAGVRSEELVESVDLLPTVVLHLGGDPNDCTPGNRPRGHELSATLLRGEPSRRDHVVTQWRDVIYTLRTARWMYLHNPDGIVPQDPPPGGNYAVGRFALFDLSVDPDEQVNVIDSHADVAARMRELVEAWKAGLHRGAAPEALTDPRLAEMLEQLGY